ncbi:MAG: molybdate ABC transporter substrate-binding protein [bacterium]|nr:molybdate ABC transporter substrate-binding protein [bacterium]
MNKSQNLIVLSLLVLFALGSVLYWDYQIKQEDAKQSALVFYCAAGMKPPVEAIRESYEKEYGVPVLIQYGGSGTLLSNLSVAKQGDLYLAADETYITQGKEKGLIDETISVAYLTPVIAVAKGNPKEIHGVDDLSRDNVALALANPDAASVGRTVKSLLTQSGDWETIQAHCKVFKPTVNDIANDIKIGSVDAGVVWDAVAAQYPELETVHAPELDAGRMRINIGVLSFTEQPTAALRFARYLTARDKGLKIFQSMGYEVVEGDVWEETPHIVFYSGSVNKPALDDTVKEFSEREGAQIDVTYNGCGILVAQMKAGERPDAYFACDVSFMHQVTDLFLDASNMAKTDIVIAVQKGNPKHIQTLNDLTKEGMLVGVCNEEQSALGYLTARLLKDAGVYEGVRKNVQSEVPIGPFLVNQTVTGSLDAVIVYDVNAKAAADQLEIIHIDHPLANATQPFAIAQTSNHKELIGRLLERIRSAQSEERFKNAGFEWLGGVPDDTVKNDWTESKDETLSHEPR